MICVESVVAAQFPALQKRHQGIRKPLLAILRYLFHESEFQSFAQQYPHLRGFDFIEQVLEYFDFSYRISSRERERIPATGPVVIIANHPIGSLDGLALLKLVGEVRQDVKVVANDLLLAIEPLHNLLLPVDNMNGRTARQNLQAIDQHLEQSGALVIFPAGEVSRLGPSGVRDGHWRNGFLRFASKAKAPILPIYVDGRNSVLFYSLSLLAKPLSTLLLIDEMFKQANRCVTVRIGHPVDHGIYSELPFDTRGVVKLFKKHIYKLAKKRGVDCLRGVAPAIAHPENRQLLRSEIKLRELLGKTRDNKLIYLYQYNGDSVVMREISRLREVSFRAVGEGTGKRRDMDRFDQYYDHIVLWDDNDLEIVGAYRLVRTGPLIRERGIEALYSHTLFEYHENAGPILEKGVELGRSFVQPRYWGLRSLDYLWYGIGAYLCKYPESRYLFGPVSLSNQFPEAAKSLLVDFYRQHFAPTTRWAMARTPYEHNDTGWFSGVDYNGEFADLKEQLAKMKVAVPTLYKQYSELCEPGGVSFVDFNVDADFADCVDGLVVVDLERVKSARRKRYLDQPSETVACSARVAAQ